MAYIPNEYTPRRVKTDVRWSNNGEVGSEAVLNRPIDDVTDMVLTLREDVYAIIEEVGNGLPDSTGKDFQEIASLGGGVTSWSPIRLNPQTLAEDFTIPSGANGQVAGPFIVNGGSLTITDGSTFVIN